MSMSAERVYRRLLIVLPSAFRDEAEAELLDTFRQSHARMADQGVLARLGFWVRTVADLAVTSGAERMQTGGGRDPIRFSPGDLMKFITDVQMAVRTLVHQRGFALPALLTAPEDVARMSAAMFTISYGEALVVSVASGAAWDIAGSARYAFLPIALSAVPLLIVPSLIRFHPSPDGAKR